MATNLRESQESVPASAPPMVWGGGPASYNEEEPPRYQSLSVEDSDHHRSPDDPYSRTPSNRRNTLNRSLAFAGNVISFYWHNVYFVLTRSFNWAFFRCSR